MSASSEKSCSRHVTGDLTKNTSHETIIFSLKLYLFFQQELKDLFQPLYNNQ